jgi:hypothetical protein
VDIEHVFTSVFGALFVVGTGPSPHETLFAEGVVVLQMLGVHTPALL